MPAEYYLAHLRLSDGASQSVQTHLTETAAIARDLAAKLELDAAGAAACVWRAVSDVLLA